MRFVEHPAVDLAVPDGADEALVPELFWRNEQDADVAQCYLVQNLCSLHHLNHAIERGSTSYAFPDQAI